MTKIVIIINEDGVFSDAYSDSEVDFKILKKGTDDDQIDKVSVDLENLIND